jgi:hypothetical protein
MGPLAGSSERSRLPHQRQRSRHLLTRPFPLVAIERIPFLGDETKPPSTLSREEEKKLLERSRNLKSRLKLASDRLRSRHRRRSCAGRRRGR